MLLVVSCLFTLFCLTVSYIDDIFHGCSLIPRVAKHLDKDFETNPEASYHYLQAIQNHPELRQMRSQLMNRVQDAMDKANRYKDKHLDYSYIPKNRLICLTNIT